MLQTGPLQNPDRLQSLNLNHETKQIIRAKAEFVKVSTMTCHGNLLKNYAHSCIVYKYHFSSISTLGEPILKRKTSKEILADSFREIADIKTIDKITVKDITENCGYSMATFYRHLCRTIFIFLRNNQLLVNPYQISYNNLYAYCILFSK